MAEQQYRREGSDNQIELYVVETVPACSVDFDELEENPLLDYSDKFQSNKDKHKIRPSRDYDKKINKLRDCDLQGRAGLRERKRAKIYGNSIQVFEVILQKE